jgi:hypothetical protein
VNVLGVTPLDELLVDVVDWITDPDDVVVVCIVPDVVEVEEPEEVVVDEEVVDVECDERTTAA